MCVCVNLTVCVSNVCVYVCVRVDIQKIYFEPVAILNLVCHHDCYSNFHMV